MIETRRTMGMRGLLLLLLPLLVTACDSEEQSAAVGAAGISQDDIARHVKVLSSDEFGGRAPSSPGEELTVAYLAEQFQALGLEPGVGDSYFQDVPLVDITTSPDTRLYFDDGDGNRMSFDYASDMVVWTDRVVEESAIEASELIFVGYGIVAPEYGWDDYAGIDVSGKTVVILVNDPGFATQDPEIFNGNTMTYYGRWTYKYEEAARQGAAGALIIHQTAPAAYGWDTVRNSWTGPQFKLETENGNMDRVAIEGWISEETARTLFEHSRVMDLDAAMAAALKPDFAAYSLGRTASVAITNTIRHSRSKNVVAVLPGAEAPDEYFIYMAHWDHLGTDASITAEGGDGIYNGALDNASGTAALLELAEAFATLPEPPRRSIVFLSVTAEEQGLLGSAHYAANPVIPLNQTVAGLNMDGLNTIGPTREITVAGYGLSELDAVLQEVATAQGRRVDPDPEPEKGYYYRSDHFELAKRGVPMIYPGAGIDHVEGGIEYGRAQSELYLNERYHMPTDEFDETWDLSGAVADVNLYYAVGEAVAGSSAWPNWNEGTEFRAIRDASLATVLEVDMSVDLNVAPDELWALIGGFNALKDWHPAISNSVLSEEGGKTFRTLSLAGGDATITERLDAMDDDGMSYSYTITESPLPVSGYSSTIAVSAGDGGGAKLTWSSHFKAAGVPDDEARAVIAGIYSAGFEALQARFPGQ